MTHRLLAAAQALALALWVGGLAAFAFDFAPLAFHLLRARDPGLFTELVADGLRRLGLLGDVAGAVALLAALLRGRGRLRSAATAQAALTAVMLAVSTFEDRVVVPRMLATFATSGALRVAASRASFDRQHHLSSTVLGVVLLCGLAAIASLAAEIAPAPRPRDAPAVERTRRPDDGG